MEIEFTNPQQSSSVDDQISEGVEIKDRLDVTDFRRFNAKGFGLAVDAFGSGTLVVKLFVLLRVAVKANPQPAAQFNVNGLDAAAALGKLFVVTALSRGLRKQERTAQ